MGYITRPGGGGSSGSSYTAPAWEWHHEDTLDISALTDVGDGDAGGDAFASTNYSNGILTGYLSASANSGFQVAEESGDFVWAVKLGWSWPEQDPSDGTSDLMVGIAFMKRDGASYSLAADDYRGVAYRIDGNLTTMALGQPNSTTSWAAAPAFHNSGTTYHGVFSTFDLVLERSGSDLTGYALSNGVLRRVFTNTSLGATVGRIIAFGRNLDADATNKAVCVLAARTTGLSISNGRLVVA